jgi:hypothetical protein
LNGQGFSFAGKPNFFDSGPKGCVFGGAAEPGNDEYFFFGGS